MENKLYSFDIDNAEWTNNSVSFRLDNLDINDCNNHDHKCSSDFNPKGIFLTKTNEEEYNVKNSSINNGKISLQLELVKANESLSPTKKNKVKLFINNSLTELLENNKNT